MNVDSTVEEMKETERELGINWRSFHAGFQGGEIANSWSVRSWPMTFVLDHQGVIRAKSSHGGMGVGIQFMRTEVEPVVELLLKNMTDE